MDLNFNFTLEEYYKKFVELQDKLKKSEEERFGLERKFNEIVHIGKEEEQAHYRKLKSQYKKFLDEDRKRQERNEQIIRNLERIETRISRLSAKTERIDILRKQYQNYLLRIANENTPHSRSKPISREFAKENMKKFKNTLIRPEKSTQTLDLQKPIYEHLAVKKALEKDQSNEEKIEVLDKYLQSLSTQRCRDLLNKERDAREKLSLDKPLIGNYPDFSSSNSTNQATAIADDIMNSIYSRYYNKSDPMCQDKKEVFPEKGYNSFGKSLGGTEEDYKNLKGEEKYAVPKRKSSVSFNDVIEIQGRGVSYNEPFVSRDEGEKNQDISRHQGETTDTFEDSEKILKDIYDKEKTTMKIENFENGGESSTSFKISESPRGLFEDIDNEPVRTDEYTVENVRKDEAINENIQSGNIENDKNDREEDNEDLRESRGKNEDQDEENDIVSQHQSEKSNMYNTEQNLQIEHDQIEMPHKLRDQNQVSQSNYNDLLTEAQVVSAQLTELEFQPEQQEQKDSCSKKDDVDVIDDQQKHDENYDHENNQQLFLNNENVYDETQYAPEDDNPIQYDQNNQPIPFDQQLQYNENDQRDGTGEPLQYNSTDQPLGYDQYNQYEQQIFYDQNGQIVAPQYDKNGQMIPQYDENGQIVVLYDQNGQQYFGDQVPYDQNNQHMYDESGQSFYDPAQQQYYNYQQDPSDYVEQYDQYQSGDQAQFIETANLETEQPLDNDHKQHDQQQFHDNVQDQYRDNDHEQYNFQQGNDQDQCRVDDERYHNNDQDQDRDTIQEQAHNNDHEQYRDNDLHDKDQEKENDFNVQKATESKNDPILEEKQDDNDHNIVEKSNETGKLDKVMDMLDTDTESKHNTSKISNDSDFDFS